MYINPPFGQQPHDLAAVQQTHHYLEACNNLFEQGFLSHRKIENENADVLQHIMEGYNFFVRWHTSLEGNS